MDSLKKIKNASEFMLKLAQSYDDDDDDYEDNYDSPESADDDKVVDVLKNISNQLLVVFYRKNSYITEGQPSSLSNSFYDANKNVVDLYSSELNTLKNYIEMHGSAIPDVCIQAFNKRDKELKDAISSFNFEKGSTKSTLLSAAAQINDIILNDVVKEYNSYQPDSASANDSNIYLQYRLDSMKTKGNHIAFEEGFDADDDNENDDSAWLNVNEQDIGSGGDDSTGIQLADEIVNDGSSDLYAGGMHKESRPTFEKDSKIVSSLEQILKNYQENIAQINAANSRANLKANVENKQKLEVDFKKILKLKNEISKYESEHGEIKGLKQQIKEINNQINATRFKEDPKLVNKKGEPIKVNIIKVLKDKIENLNKQLKDKKFASGQNENSIKLELRKLKTEYDAVQFTIDQFLRERKDLEENYKKQLESDAGREGERLLSTMQEAKNEIRKYYILNRYMNLSNQAKEAFDSYVGAKTPTEAIKNLIAFNIKYTKNPKVRKKTTNGSEEPADFYNQFLAICRAQNVTGDDIKSSISNVFNKYILDEKVKFLPGNVYLGFLEAFDSLINAKNLENDPLKTRALKELMLMFRGFLQDTTDIVSTTAKAGDEVDVYQLTSNLMTKINSYTSNDGVLFRHIFLYAMNYKDKAGNPVIPDSEKKVIFHKVYERISFMNENIKTYISMLNAEIAKLNESKQEIASIFTQKRNRLVLLAETILVISKALAYAQDMITQIGKKDDGAMFTAFKQIEDSCKKLIKDIEYVDTSKDSLSLIGNEANDEIIKVNKKIVSINSTIKGGTISVKEFDAKILGIARAKEASEEQFKKLKEMLDSATEAEKAIVKEQETSVYKYIVEHSKELSTAPFVLKIREFETVIRSLRGLSNELKEHAKRGDLGSDSYSIKTKNKTELVKIKDMPDLQIAKYTVAKFRMNFKQQSVIFENIVNDLSRFVPKIKDQSVGHIIALNNDINSLLEKYESVLNKDQPITGKQIYVTKSEVEKG